MKLTSTFAFRSPEESTKFFDVVAVRGPAPEGMGTGAASPASTIPNTEIVTDRLSISDGAESRPRDRLGNERMMGAVDARPTASGRCPRPLHTASTVAPRARIGEVPTRLGRPDRALQR